MSNVGTTDEMPVLDPQKRTVSYMGETSPTIGIVGFDILSILIDGTVLGVDELAHRLGVSRKMIQMNTAKARVAAETVGLYGWLRVQSGKGYVFKAPPKAEQKQAQLTYGTLREWVKGKDPVECARVLARSRIPTHWITSLLGCDAAFVNKAVLSAPQLTPHEVRNGNHALRITPDGI